MIRRGTNPSQLMSQSASRSPKGSSPLLADNHPQRNSSPGNEASSPFPPDTVVVSIPSPNAVGVLVMSFYCHNTNDATNFAAAVADIIGQSPDHPLTVLNTNTQTNGWINIGSPDSFSSRHRSLTDTPGYYCFDGEGSESGRISLFSGCWKGNAGQRWGLKGATRAVDNIFTGQLYVIFMFLLFIFL